MWLDNVLSKLLKSKDLTKQNYSPQSDGLIFHYCDSTAFWSICTNRSLWLSSIFNMNDSHELKWGRDILIRVLKENKHLFSQEFGLYIIHNVYRVDCVLLPLIASFSKNGDLLSQWRFYADDGGGYSIGFSEETVSNTLPVNMKEVLYDLKEQKELVYNSLVSFYKFWKKHSEKSLVALEQILMEFSIDLASLKNPSFHEESEVRIIHLIVKNYEDNDWVDPGGNNIYKDFIPGTVVRTREIRNNKVPYIDMPLVNAESIQKIILGPKNRLSIPAVKDKLTKNGLSHVSVERSISTYR